MRPRRQAGSMVGSQRTPNSQDEKLGRRHRPDYFLVMAMVLLLSLGLVVIYSVSPAISAQLTGDVDQNHFMYRQVLFLLLGFATFIVTSMLPLQIWKQAARYIIGFAILSFILLFIPALSLSHGGATRWVDIGFMTYQPAEVLKFGLIFYLAAKLAHRISQGKLDTSETIKWFMTVLGLVTLEIVIIQRDLGTMIPIVAIMFSMLYLSGLSWRRFSRIMGVLIMGAILSIIVAPHRMARVFTFLNPGDDLSGGGYHINQALIAVGSGGIFGNGLGRSVQAYGYLPEAANDSIFAIMAEKFGFVGMTIVFLIYGFLMFRILDIVARAPNMYLRLVAGGVLSWIAVQAFVNVGAMLGVMPLTGVTLPLLSFGGTSLIFTLAAMGVVFNISRYTTLGYLDTERKDAREDSIRRRGLGRPRYSA